MHHYWCNIDLLSNNSASKSETECKIKNHERGRTKGKTPSLKNVALKNKDMAD